MNQMRDSMRIVEDLNFSIGTYTVQKLVLLKGLYLVFWF